MVTEVSFSLTGCGLISVPGYVNGRGPFNFTVDTGAGVSLISPGLAHELGIAATGSEYRTGAGGRVEVAIGQVQSLAIGAARLGLKQVRISDDLDKFSAAAGEKIDGNIGYDYLGHYRLTIDYGRGILGLAQTREDLEDSDMGARMKFRVANSNKPLILVPVFANGAGPYQFALDTGASATVISPELARDLGISNTDVVQALGAGGSVTAAVGSIESLAVGDAEIRNLGVAVVDFFDRLSREIGEKLDGIIGYNYLKEFRLTIDYPSQILYLEQTGRKRSSRAAAIRTLSAGACDEHTETGGSS